MASNDSTVHHYPIPASAVASVASLHAIVIKVTDLFKVSADLYIDILNDPSRSASLASLWLLREVIDSTFGKEPDCWGHEEDRDDDWAVELHFDRTTVTSKESSGNSYTRAANRNGRSLPGLSHLDVLNRSRELAVSMA
jgi:hypothetical protein